MEVHISYKTSLRHHRVKRVLGLWSKNTKASAETKNHILKEWRKGTIDLRINRDDFIQLIKEINGE